MPRKPDDDVEVLVTIDEKSRGRVKSLASALKKSGLKVSQVLEATGIVAGMARPADFDRIKQHKGVSALEVAGTVTIAPPDAEIQ